MKGFEGNLGLEIEGWRLKKGGGGGGVGVATCF